MCVCVYISIIFTVVFCFYLCVWGFVCVCVYKAITLEGSRRSRRSYRWSGADKVNKNKLAVPEEHLTQVGRESRGWGGRVGLKKRGELLTETSILKI